MRERPLQQNSSFGLRKPGSLTGAPDRGSSPTRLPIRIEKQIGVRAAPLCGVTALVLVVQALPLLLSPGSMADALLHGATGVVDVGILAVVAVICVLGRNRAELEITAQGVRLVSKRGRWFYDWADIERAVETPAGVRLLLKGRSDDQNSYNVIPSRFGLNPSQLFHVITEGVERFGGARSSPSGRTVSPGDDLRGARQRAIKTCSACSASCSQGCSPPSLFGRCWSA